MAKGKRVSSRWNSAFYCKVDKEVQHMIKTRYMLGLKEIVLSLPTFHNEHKRGKVRTINMGDTYIVAHLKNELSIDKFRLTKQGQSLNWVFTVHG